MLAVMMNTKDSVPKQGAAFWTDIFTEKKNTCGTRGLPRVLYRNRDIQKQKGLFNIVFLSGWARVAPRRVSLRHPLDRPPLSPR
ncbi:hypothetical protein EVAR_46504_1 [Eumeta japonica]|uniref:Uncharacterized protein n=1 Tax=Eumeta variegata TaxID=151549 RepID=A0A4C1WRY0_EUMVA|nr:hypothetical protein EVAR_46504_1 [Eumeta japonica]